ncbi:MAG: trypsin-like peptidase domain-containing protein [Dehalococcoidales bacterium]|nr:trypsin-like peptidase domain-containing protein [Dehalococcoidales bacterium]
MKGQKLKYYLTGLILVVLVFAVAGCDFMSLLTTPTTTTKTTTTPTTTMTSSTTDTTTVTWTPPVTQTQNPELSSYIDVVKKVRPSVVAINAEVTVLDIFGREYSEEVAGSGWILGILDSSTLIVTNNHVIDGAFNITVTLEDGMVLPATIKGADALSDLAILKVNKTGLTAAAVGDSSNLQIGQAVMALGNALGEGISATEGIVSRTGASLAVETGQTLTDLIQTSAAINPGNSGGPLVNMSGEVVGITSAKLAALGVEGMGYAISTRTALPIIEELVQKGYVVRPYLGVNLQTVNAWTVLQYRLGVNYGAFISAVGTNSPAEAAGLQTGDVIVKFNGEDIHSADDCLAAIHSAKIGDTVSISYWRGDTQYTTQATLQESPPPG